MESPGINYDLPFAEYAKIPALNSSILKYGHPPSGSMLHLKAAIAGEIESEDTRDRKFGRALHVRLLEPERYAKEILIAGQCTAIKKSKQRCENTGKFYVSGEWLCGVHADLDCDIIPKDYIDPDEAQRIERMAETLKHHDCQRLFRAKGWSEVSVFWDYRGHPMKARIDRLSEEISTIIDLKKAQVGAVHRQAMEKSILQYGWHRQAALYVDGVGYETGKEFAFVWIFIEDKPPFDVGILRAAPEVLDAGRFEYKQIINNYDYALRKDKFDGTNPIPRRIQGVDDLDSGGLPGWYLQQLAGCDTAGSYAFSGDSEGGD